MVALIAVDTNVVVSFLLKREDPSLDVVERVRRESLVQLSPTVLLEAEWVLRNAYDRQREAVLDAFERLLAMPNVSVQPEGVVERAIELARDGVDLADAIHLAGAEGVDALVTSDRRFIKAAARIGAVPPVRAVQDFAS